MIKIGITGSLASGKSTVAKIFARGSHPLFNADLQVNKIYKQKIFINKIYKVFRLKNKKNIKSKIKNIIKKKRSEIKKVEKIIHPLVRKQIKIFIKKNKKKRLIFFEIPLLFESNLARNYDVIIFVNSSRKKRLKRYLKRGNNKEMFNLLDKRQLSSKKKIKFSDYVINNNGSLNKLKIKIKSIKNKL